MKILNFGSCNIDYVYSLEHIVRAGETESTTKMEIFSGGKGLNQSIAIARAGSYVYHAGCIGEDGESLRTLLQESGVDVTFLQTKKGKNGHAIIQLDDAGQNSIFLYPGTNEMIDKDFIDSVLENFEKGDILLLQNEISNVKYVIERAHEKNMCIIFNPSPCNEKIKEIDFSKLNFILINEVEAKQISNCDTAEAALIFFKTYYAQLKVILTLGEKGCVFIDGDKEIHQCAFKVNAVDTTGAGDTFTGYFVAGLSSGENTKEILQLSSAASAIAVSRKGAAPSIPKKEEVLQALSVLKKNITDNRSEFLLNKIESYLENNIANANLKELSKILGYTEVYTGSLVRKLTNKSFSKLIKEKRCSIAAKKLLNSDLSISAIINSVGYENEGFFRKIFKEYYKVNPLEYRKKKN